MDEQDDNATIDHSFTGSSWVASAAYSRQTQEMTVYTKAGHAYDLSGVPPDMFEAFCKSSSPGRYFNSMLRGKY